MSSLHASIHAPAKNVTTNNSNVGASQGNRDQRVTFATSDHDLKCRILRYGLRREEHSDDYSFPRWLNGKDDITNGDPSRIFDARLEALDNGSLPESIDEIRYIRNKAAVQHVAFFMARKSKKVKQLEAQKARVILKPGRPAQGKEPQHVSQIPQHPRMVMSNSQSSLTPHSMAPLPVSVSIDSATPEGSFAQLRKPVSEITTAPLAATKAEELQLHERHCDALEAQRLKRTVLAPFYNRIQQDTEEIIRLREQKAKLAADVWQYGREVTKLRHEAQKRGPAIMSQPNGVNVSQLRGVKRKVPPTSPMRIGDVTNGNDEYTTEGHLIDLANKISKDLGEAVPNETIHLCGLSQVKLMDDCPDDVLAIASEKLRTWPDQKLPTCWRRLYEDASLSKAVQILREQAVVVAAEHQSKRARSKQGELDAGKRRPIPQDNAAVTPDVGSRSETESSKDWIADIVKALDMGMSLSGAPGRTATFEAVFQQLENLVEHDTLQDIPSRFPISVPQSLSSENAIARSETALSFEMFQRHLHESAVPLIIPGTLMHWPATQNWQSPGYFLRLTLGGRRLVPIEIGKSYADEAWGQQIISFKEFLKTYVLAKDPKEVGYLAQHDLFAQIPALRADITIPDYCYSSPPKADAAFSRTSGLAATAQLSEPLLNAWLGPKGTTTPLHTDPYHNILCQVVGYKYIRLYAPDQTPNLYPRGVDAKGINMENTSQVDVSHERWRSLGNAYDLEALRQIRRDFPLFGEAKYVEGILAPGECLYIPLGWWHYVESLTTSFSVSFWWN